MANTFVKIATVTVGSGGASTIDFTSIPQTYTDLKLIFSGRLTNAVDVYSLYPTFNGSGSSFSSKRFIASGTSRSSDTTGRLAGLVQGTSYTASIFGSLEMYIPNYTSSANKSFSVDDVTENNGSAAYMNLLGGLWSNTAAITSISIGPSAGTLAQYSTATLYGIKNS
jgi:hypothetical protein